jgi:riboflavin biosynthesis pyrimidine reductase
LVVVAVVLVAVTVTWVVVVAIIVFLGICFVQHDRPRLVVRVVDGVAQNDHLYDVRPYQVVVSDANQWHDW